MKNKKEEFCGIFFAVIFSIVAFLSIGVSDVHAAAELTVSKSVSQPPLLGGTATYTITVQNVGDEKGYNLSIIDLFSSSRINPEGQIQLISVSDSDGTIPPNSVIFDSGTGDTEISLINIRDLAATESYSVTLEVDLSGDLTWEVDDLLNNDVLVEVNTLPDGNGSSVVATDSNSAPVVPIRLAKSVNQSTSAEQATGTIDRVYSYTLDVQNNFVNQTDDVVLVDTLPDGVEFLGVTSGPTPDAGFPVRDPATGETVIQWTIGAMSASALESITYDTGIRYDYYGTDNGGTNRTHDDFGGTPPTGTPIPDKTRLTNSVELTADYQGKPVVERAESSVTAAYATLSKSSDVSSGGNGTIITYTLTYTTSEYYSVIDDDATSITIHDLLPDGQTYNNDASPVPSAVVPNGDGTTDITWDPSVLSELPASDTFSITFSATVDDDYQNGDPIVSNDSLQNTADSTGIWDDQVDSSRSDGTTGSSAANFALPIPAITKEVEDPDNPGTWVDVTQAKVGDTLRMRLRFNTIDGATPLRADVNMGDIVLTDWLPPGMVYNGDAVETFSSAGHFSTGGYDGPPDTVTIGSLDGLEWDLGDVDKNGWWQAVFTVDVVDDSIVDNGTTVNNLFKLTGVNTAGIAYSNRDGVSVAYQDPHLILTKTATDVPDPLVSGSTVEYTVTIENIGETTAYDLLFTDTIANGMRATTPVITSINNAGTPLSENVDYTFLPAYNSSTGEWTIDFNDSGSPSVTTNLSSGATLTIVYEVIVDGGLGAGARLDNIATIGYNTQPDGSGRTTPGTSDPDDDNTDDESLRLAPLTIEKSVDPGPFTVGDTYTYTLDITVPEGMYAYWPRIVDRLNRDGVEYVPGSTTLTHISGSPTTPATFDATTNPDPTVNTSGTNQTRLTWLFTNPINNFSQSDDYVFRITYDVVYTGVEDNGTSWEFFPPAENDRVTNRAQIQWHTRNSGSRATNQTARSRNIRVDIDQPLLDLEKTVLSSDPHSPDLPVEYEVTFTNVGYSTAYDITWEDDIDTTKIISASLTSVTHSSSGALTSGDDFLEDFSGDPLTIDFDGGSTDTHLAVGESITITYTTMIRENIGAAAAINNTADVDWSSQDGATPDERVYNDSPEEASYTDDTDTERIAVNRALFEKSITQPVPAEAPIGDVIDYALQVVVPKETVLYSPTLQDVIATDGMAYVPGSAALTQVSGDPEVAAALTGDPTVTMTSPNPGATLDFTFTGDIDNSNTSSPTGDTDYVFTITYQMLVTGEDDGSAWIWDPAVTGHTTTNTATLTWSDGATTQTESDDATLAIQQPFLALEKNFDVETVAGGDVVMATIVITNNGNSTAYEYDHGADFIDTVPDGFFAPTVSSVAHSTHGVLSDPADYTVTIVGNDIALEYNSAQTNLAPGETLTIVYTLAVDPIIGSGATLTNAADTDYSSIDGPSVDERVFDDTDPLDGTQDEDSDTVSTPLATLDKTHNAFNAEVTIGEEFDYVITAAIPENTTIYNAAITDVIPDGFTVVSTSTAPAIGTVTVGAEVAGETPVTWNIGDLSNPPATDAILTIRVELDDTFDNGDFTDGLPVGVDGDGQDVITNDAELVWDDADTGGSQHTTMSPEVDVTVVEPHVVISKSVDPTVASAGDTLAYTITMENIGVATAFDIRWEDMVPPELFNAPANPTLTTVTHSVLGTLTEGTQFTQDFTTNPLTLNFTDVPSPTYIAAGETITITYETVADMTVSSGDVLVNTTQGTYISQAGGSRFYTTNQATAQVTIIGPDLAIIKDDGNTTAVPGDTVVYTLDYVNNGDAVTPNAVLTETVPDNTTFDSDASTAGWSCSPDNSSGSVCTRSLGDLDSGDSGSADFAVTIDAPLAAGVDQIDNTASIADDGSNGTDPTPDDNTDDDDTPVTAAPDLTITKDDGGATLRQGDTVTYTLTYANVGNQDATTVVITETVPDHTVFSPSASTAGWVCAPDTTAGNTCTFAIGDLAGGGAGGSVTFTLRLDDPVAVGVTQINNTAVISDDGVNGVDPTPDNNTASDDTPILFDPPLGEKTVNGDDEPNLLWRMVWINEGNAGPLALRVVDPLPSGTAFVAGSLGCEARGTSVQTVCAYDSVRNEIIFEGTLGPDFGATDEATAVNEVIMTFRSEITDKDARLITNVAKGFWDENNDGVVDDDDTYSADNPIIVTADFAPSKGCGASIGNTVWLDKNGNGRQDHDEPGIENIRLKLIDEDGNEFRTDTNHNGHYIFEDLWDGTYKVQVKEEDVENFIQTYDETGELNHRATVKLDCNDDHTKADFGYREDEEKTQSSLAQTGKDYTVHVLIALGVATFLTGIILFLSAMRSVARREPETVEIDDDDAVL